MTAGAYWVFPVTFSGLVRSSYSCSEQAPETAAAERVSMATVHLNRDFLIIYRLILIFIQYCFVSGSVSESVLRIAFRACRLPDCAAKVPGGSSPEGGTIRYLVAI